MSVKGSYNHCPSVIFFASPDHAPVGYPIALTSSVSDDDGDALSYVWTATSGTFSSTNSSSTTFRCTVNGAVTIKLTVADASCPAYTSGPIICQPADGGAPDAPSSGAAGQSGTGGQTGAAGQSGSAGRGGSTGVAGSGGAGGITGTGSGGTTGSAGTSGGGGTGTGGTGGGGACVETDPPAAIAAACTECLDANDNPTTDGCCAVTDAAGLQLCRAASACIRTAGCNALGDVTGCYCGTASRSTCESGQPNGPCVAQFNAAAARNTATKMTDSPTATQVLARQGDPNYALGRCANIHGVAGIFCSIECGIGM